MAAALAEILRSASVEMTESTIFVEAGRMWLRHIHRPESGLAPRTLDLYGYAFDRYIDTDGSPFRAMTLTQANNPQRLRAFLTHVADTRGTASQKLARTIISGVLNFAIDNGVLDTNGTAPLRAIKASTPRPSKHQTRRSLTVEEQAQVVAFSDARAAEPDLNPRTQRKLQASADLIAYMFGTGTRINEARTLRWEHVDLDSGRVKVHGTKSRSARRGINLPASLRDRLSARAERCGGEGYVFASPAFLNSPESLWDGRQIQREIRTILDSAGFPWATSHTFRRTVATRLDERGARARDIADQLGHAQIRTTIDHYISRDFNGDRAHIARLLE
ncbi:MULTISPECIES: site-specific integrase [unclassified Aeromicrobium]|uniref:tyrosine-type recombinase/integrase n=1 Tax=unclassified Aeromicrobium TaxID=2633570 RepID=UPI00288BBCB8|nr:MULTISPECIES: site-specific integrase [unclassified Aeromicrobium]